MENKVEFKLRFLLNSLTLKVISVRQLTDPKKVLAFNDRFCETRKVQGFCTGISETTHFPMLGVSLTPGSKIHTAYFCEISVGKSLYVGNNYADTLPVPSGYDTLVVSNREHGGLLMDDEVDVAELYYVIKDAERILPLYEVTFEYDEDFEKLSKNSFICHRCKKMPAVMFCPSERASFCKDCDIQVHYDEFLKRHGRVYFADVGQKKFICCGYHPTRVVEYFCETCMEPVCTECKITGNHSGGERNEHPIMPFLDACQMLKSRILECTRPLANTIEACDRDISRFKEKVWSLKTNLADARRHLEREFRDLMHQLDVIEDAERQVANANYAERLVLFKTFCKMEAYPAELDPADLLSEFKNIQELTRFEALTPICKYEPEKVEICGKVVLNVQKGHDRDTPVECKDKSVRWRIETKHMVKESESE